MSTRKKFDRRSGQLSNEPIAPLAPAPRPSFDRPAGARGAALAALGDQVTAQFGEITENQENLNGQFHEFTSQLTAVQDNVAALQADSRTAAQREQELIDGPQFAEVRDQLEHLQQSNTRLEDLLGSGGGFNRSNDHPGLSSFARELAENEELIAWRESDDTDLKLKIKMSSLVPFRTVPAFGASTVIVDDSAVGDGSQPAQAPGLVQLLRDDIGLVDVVNQVPPETADQYKRLVEKDVTLKGAVAAKSTADVDGDGTPVDEIVLDNVEGYWAGKEVYVYTTDTGREGPHTIDTVDTSASKITFATAVITYQIMTGDLICSENYLMTGESDFAPAGVGEIEELAVDMQAMPSYIPVTWQRMKRTNLFALIPWLEGLLRERKRWNLEMHLLYGDGVTNNKQLHGFLNAANLVNTDVWATLMAAGDNVIDLIIRSASLIPGGGQKICVCREEDWQAAIYAKNSTLDYVHGEGEGPKIINTPALKAVGAVRVVTSAIVALKTAVIFQPLAASDFVPGGDAELIIGHINAQLITGEAVIVSRESFGHLLTNMTQAVRKITFTTAPS